MGSIVLTSLSCFALYYTSQRLHPVYVVIGIALTLLFVAAHCFTAIINPGIPDRDTTKYTKEQIAELVRTESPRYCVRCKVVRNAWQRTVHCSTCDLCVEEYDHHCMWTGKCIGRGNLSAFYVLTISSFLLIIYTTVTALISHS